MDKNKTKIESEISKNKKLNKNIINLSIIFVIFLGMSIYIIATDGFYNIFNTLKNINLQWAILGLIFMIIYWLLEAVALHIATKSIYKQQNFLSTLRISMIGQLFNSITPFSSGGQPMQMVAMKVEGKSLSKSATILLIKFIVYQATLVIYTLIVILFRYSYFKSLVSNFIDLALIGFLINFFVIISLVTIGINKQIVEKFAEIIFKFLAKLKIIKNEQDKIERINKSIDKFHINFKFIKKEKLVIFKIFICTIIQLTVFFLVTYAVYKAFGQAGNNVIDIISAQAFLIMIMSFVPIPGAGIAAEGGFLVIFNTFFKSNTINMAILFWRLYTFYLPIIVGAMFMLKNHKKDEILKERGQINE